MYAGEADMLQMRLEELDGKVWRHVIAEATVTHRGVPKPLHYLEDSARFTPWRDRIIYTPVGTLAGVTEPWAREHQQRNAAWPAIADAVAGIDVVLICDTDEIPSGEALAWRGPAATSLFMRTALFAVDWLVPPWRLPPTAVAANAGWLRSKNGDLAHVRDNRGAYPVIREGGTHFSWIGGPDAHRRKLEESTCHTELLGTPEGDLIARGERWRTSQDGGGLPVVPADVDGTWPAMIRERRCPANWFRPRP